MAQAVYQPLPARVAAVLATARTWTPGRRKSDGKPFFFVPGSEGAVYMTATDGCTCPAAQNSRTGDCKHQEAVRQYSTRQHPRKPEPRCWIPSCPLPVEPHEGGCRDHMLGSF